MAENSSGQKTEQPTPRRLEKAREEGQVAKSQELNSAFTLLGSFLALYLLFTNMIKSLFDRMAGYLSMSQVPELTSGSALVLITDGFYYIMKLVGPVMIAAAAVGALISFLQTGPLFTLKAVQPKFSRINPLEGAKRLFSLRSVTELIKSLAKAVAIGYLTYRQIKGAWPHLISLTGQGIEPALIFAGSLIFRVGVSIIIFLVVLGVADYIYQRWDWKKNLMMSKYEVKQEYKESEGDPQIKQRRRQLQRQMSMNRMIKEVESADVVITNPTHIAVALKFDMETMEVPLVVAKGEGFIAEKIREKARESGVEIVENKPLARLLNKTAEIGEEIPQDLYQAVAEILAYVYRKNKKLKM